MICYMSVFGKPSHPTLISRQFYSPTRLSWQLHNTIVIQGFVTTPHSVGTSRQFHTLAVGIEAYIHCTVNLNILFRFSSSFSIRLIWTGCLDSNCCIVTLSFLRLYHIPGISIGHLHRVRLANRGRLLLRTPGPVAFWTCICSNVETIHSLTCHVYRPLEFRTSLGTSILLTLKKDDM